MGMSLADLRKAGGIVPREPVKKEVTWKTTNEAGEDVEHVFDVYIVRQTFGSFRETLKVTDRDHSAEVIARSVMLQGAKGKLEHMTYEDAYQLDLGLSAVLLQAVNDVNGTSVKNLIRATNSSVNSSPEGSAEEL